MQPHASEWVTQHIVSELEEEAAAAAPSGSVGGGIMDKLKRLCAVARWCDVSAATSLEAQQTQRAHMQESRKRTGAASGTGAG